MKIHLADRFGKYCITKIQGRSLYLLMVAAIKMEDVLEINMSRVLVISSDFLEESIGEIMRIFTKKQVYSYIKFLNSKSIDEQSIQFSIEFYHKYHRDSNYRKLVDLENDVQVEENINAPKKKTRSKRQTKQDICTRTITIPNI